MPRLMTRFLPRHGEAYAGVRFGSYAALLAGIGSILRIGAALGST